MEPIERGKRILVIDEDEATRLRMSWNLSKAGYCVDAYEDGAHGIEAATRLEPDVVLVAMGLDGLSGIDVISSLHNTLPDTAIIGMTAYRTAELEAIAVRAGADGLLAKPATAGVLRATVRQVLFEHLAV